MYFYPIYAIHHQALALDGSTQILYSGALLAATHLSCMEPRTYVVELVLVH